MKMTMNVLATADALSDQDLLTRLDHLAGRERETIAELVAHLAALDERPSLYAAKGYSSLFAYCREALRLSEDATCAAAPTERGAAIGSRSRGLVASSPRSWTAWSRAS